MIERCFDADRINDLANHPSIHPWVSINNEPVDLAPVVFDARNIILLGEFGGFVMHNLGFGDYEAHSLFLPEGRGRNALETAKATMDFMFHQTDCERLLARCPKGNLPVLAFVRALRFDYLRTDEKAWPTSKGLVDQKWYVMPRDKWMKGDARCQ
jgi:RimJ/RimL family protein N-acetyltransferase